MFCFSSRRRHTRLQGDWSSDVCSSDLKGLGVPSDYGQAAAWYEKAAKQNQPQAQNNLGVLYEKGLGVSQDMDLAARSEERRVGKESRSRRRAYEVKKKNGRKSGSDTHN